MISLFLLQVAVAIDWSNNTGWDNWKLHYGNVEGSYSQVVDTKELKSANVENLDVTKKWCFAVQGYTASQNSPLGDPLCFDASDLKKNFKPSLKSIKIN